MFLLRHGQSYFNLYFTGSRVDPGIPDPELTPLGIEQAQAAARGLTDAALTRIIVSPYLRALQTAEPFRETHQATMQFMHDVRERAAFTCDVGTAPGLLAERFPHHDFNHLPHRWWSECVESEQATVERADVFRAAMACREDSATTLLVSHWAFILALTGRSLGNGEVVEYDPRDGAPRIIDWNV
jgi:broad specificity phosphatase PhoE